MVFNTQTIQPIKPFMKIFMHENIQIDFIDPLPVTVSRSASPIINNQSVINLGDGLPEKNKDGEKKKELAIQVDADSEDEMGPYDIEGQLTFVLLFLINILVIVIVVMLCLGK